MFIEIKGTGFTNKGAELMLHAVLEQVSKRIPGAKFVHVPGGEDSSYEKRIALGLYQKIWFCKHGIPVGLYFGKFVPRKIRARYGLVTHEEIKIVFDASGFSYSDQWGIWPSVVMAKSCKKWKSIGTKIILLPQAFGPFTLRKIRKTFKMIADKADLIYARDKISYNHIVELAGERPNIRIAPDFTNLVDGIVPDYFTSKDEKFCIIPNYRMIDKTNSEKSKMYLTFLTNCVQYLNEKGEQVFILIHEGEKDLFLAKEIVKNIKTGKPIEIIREVDSLKIKGIIGNCKGVISSRFHGLVSALSQGIPSLCTGWSHKYKMLFDDYGFPEGVLSVKLAYDQIRRAIDLIAEEPSRVKIKNKLVSESNKQKIIVEKMWEEIFKEIALA